MICFSLTAISQSRNLATSPLRHFAISPLRNLATSPLRHFATSPLRNLALSQSRHFAISRSRNLALSRSRNLATSQSRALALSQSRNLAFMSRWGKRLPRCPVCLREASRDDRNRERLRHRGECLRQSLPEMRLVRDIPPDSFFFGFRQIA